MQFVLALIVIINIAAIVFYLLTIRTWYPIWREDNHGVVHALGLTNTALIILSIAGICRSVVYLTDGSYRYSYGLNLLAALLLLATAIVQYALSRGYFSTRGNNNANN